MYCYTPTLPGCFVPLLLCVALLLLYNKTALEMSRARHCLVASRTDDAFQGYCIGTTTPHGGIHLSPLKFLICLLTQLLRLGEMCYDAIVFGYSFIVNYPI
jgi:hypothetical protein